jgi:hypothetical protein
MPYSGSDDDEELYSVPSYVGQSFKPAEITARRQELENFEYLKSLISGRPERKTVIGSGDISDLCITLYKTEDVMDFLSYLNRR